MPLPDPPKKVQAKGGTLWMYTMPRLNASILEDVAKEMNLMWFGQMVNLHPTQWVEFKARCAKKLGLPEDWEDLAYLHAYNLAKQQGWGKKFGPGSPGGWRKREKKEYVETDRSHQGWDTSDTLFAPDE